VETGIRQPTGEKERGSLMSPGPKSKARLVTIVGQLVEFG